MTFIAFILFAASIPQTKPLPVFQSTQLVTTETAPDMQLYSEDGSRVASCEMLDNAPIHCQIEKGYTLEDVMAAWLHAYLNK